MVSFEHPEKYRYFITRCTWSDNEYEYLYYGFENSASFWSKEKLQNFDYHSSLVIVGLLKRIEVGNNRYKYGLTPNDIFLNVN